MKNDIKYYMFLLVICVFGVLPWTSVSHADQPKRFEEVVRETVYNPSDGHTSGEVIYVYHDKESGAEIVCVVGGAHYNMSCVTTGRNWK